MFSLTLSALCFAVPAFAQTAASAAVNLAPIGVGIGMALAAGLCGLGQGKAVGVIRRSRWLATPAPRAGIQLLLILGLAFIESLTLFTFAMILSGSSKANSRKKRPHPWRVRPFFLA